MYSIQGRRPMDVEEEEEGEWGPEDNRVASPEEGEVEEGEIEEGEVEVGTAGARITCCRAGP
jgi:hypothetical protein